MTLQPLLLCTDLDRTLLPNGAESESPDARSHFRRLASLPEIALVYVSGRDRGRVQHAIENYRLPRPHMVVSDVGTTIHDLRNGDWQVWTRWQKEIAPDWNGFDHDGLRRLFLDIGELRLQEYSKQARFKLSYYVPLHANIESISQHMQSLLTEREVSASLVWSIDEPAGVGLLDVLPACATKLHAVEFLQQALGFRNDRTLFAGDSGNDLPVLISPIPSVLVANAMGQVIQDAETGADKMGNGDAFYHARGGFLGMNGNYAAGILEGVAHYHPDIAEVLKKKAER
ncbi:MAG: haloacid dehalogenase [endosymbiont of Escarpia spicata]|uniref:Haloacid dehalogenase n=1 Tax=endosymbiont of Escarpia spicata TaxID=2200908 RepID=A0A370DJN7_9GAMM|nr:MAG: haloacid dehalogenase [endosymbiont of Escarpia spicata]